MSQTPFFDHLSEGSRTALEWRIMQRVQEGEFDHLDPAKAQEAVYAALEAMAKDYRLVEQIRKDFSEFMELSRGVTRGLLSDGQRILSTDPEIPDVTRMPDVRCSTPGLLARVFPEKGSQRE